MPKICPTSKTCWGNGDTELKRMVMQWLVRLEANATRGSPCLTLPDLGQELDPGLPRDPREKSDMNQKHSMK